MGSDNVVSEPKIKYLPESEIKIENSFFLRDLFNKYKNSDGFINQIGLSKMTNYLIDKSTLDIIIKICGSRNNKLIYSDLLYFYALLKTKRFDAKLNFILYFIFMTNEHLNKEIYISLVKKFYKISNLLSSILLNENIINNDKIEKSKVFEYIKDNFKEEIENYQLNKEICNFALELEQVEKEREIIDKDNNNNNKNEDNKISRMNTFNSHVLNNKNLYCQCLKQKNSLCVSFDFYRMNSTFYNQFNSLKEQYEDYKKLNNGIFPFTLLEDMLKEINIKPSLIDLIDNYIKKKS